MRLSFVPLPASPATLSQKPRRFAFPLPTRGGVRAREAGWFVLAAAGIAFGGAGSALAQSPGAPVPPAVAAQPTAALPSPDASDYSRLGRLFFTPAQRTRLDELRHRPPTPPAEVARSAEPPRPPAPRYVTVNGVVRRSDGESVVWINNKPVQGSGAEDGLLVSPARGRPPGHVTVRVPQSGRSIDVKVGQQVELNSGAVQEAYRLPPATPEITTVPAKPPLEESSARAADRRADREREFLRELLREIESQSPAQRPDSPASDTAKR